MNNWNNGRWCVDYAPDTEKGEIIQIKTNKRFYFSKNIGLPAIIPAYVRKIAWRMCKGEKNDSFYH